MGTPLTFIGMVIVTTSQVGTMVIGKIALSNAMNKYVSVFYFSTLSTILLLPCSLFFHRSNRVSLTFSIIIRIFLIALITLAVLIFAAVGLEYSAPILNSAMLNLIPAFTFVLAIIFRMEKLAWRSRSSMAKFIGTIVSITGAFVVTFYKGPLLMNPSSASVLLHSQQFILSQKSNWILGGFFFASGSILISAMYILQAVIIKKSPAVFTIMFYTSLFCAIMSGLFGLIVVKDASAWRLKTSGLIFIVYVGIISTLLEYSLRLWCIGKAGPLYVSMFKPLTIIFSIALDYFFLGESLGIGSLIGAVIIVTGFYSVMWAKANDETEEKVPLLQNKTEDV